MSEPEMPEGLMTTDQMREKYEVRYFMAPYVAVTRRRDGVKGILSFTHLPRHYFDFQEDVE